MAANNLAWILATEADAALRDMPTRWVSEGPRSAAT